jgi:hypothetical protein
LDIFDDRGSLLRQAKARDQCKRGNQKKSGGTQFATPRMNGKAEFPI